MTYFWSEIVSGFGEPGGTPPRRIPTSIPPRQPARDINEGFYKVKGSEGRATYQSTPTCFTYLHTAPA